MRVFDKDSTCDNSKVTLEGIKYTLQKVPYFPDVFNFQVNEPDKMTDSITLTRQELRALFFLVTCNKCE